MANYINLLDFLNKRKVVQARISAHLIVDKKEVAENVQKIKEEAKDKKLKSQVRVLLKRELTDQEQLLRTFSEEQPAAQADNTIDLEFKRNFFYVVNPDGKIIDCAKIYSFMHEDNIHQRIIAKTLKDVDER